ncbi:MAG: hypothetical protein K1V95_02885 [Eubacterium sp.]
MNSIIPSILQSIHPFHCENIAIGRKGYEVRKTKPKLKPPWLNDAAPKQIFKNKDLQLLMFDKRMKFSNDGKINNKITFSSSYFCYKFLPKQIIMETLEIN